MKRIVLGLAAAGLMAASAASAQTPPTLQKAIYRSTGQVSSNNGAATCAQVGLSVGAANLSKIAYPGAGVTGFILYVPFSGALQLCNRFPATPATGLTNWTANAKCALDGPTAVPGQTVNFAFTSTTTDTHSAYGTTTVTIPAANTLGAGCQATIATSLVIAGH